MVSRNLGGGAGAGVIRIAVVATGTGVHGGDEHEIGWVGSMLIGAGKGDLTIFEGLAKRFEDVAGVFGEFVEKEDATMSKGDFPWVELKPTTQNGGCAGGVMGRTKGALSKIGGGSRGEGMELGDFDLLGRGGWREKGSGETRQEGLAGAWRASEEEIVAAGNSNGEGAFGGGLTVDLVEKNRWSGGWVGS